MNERNQRLLNAVLERAEALCPGELALLGIYGSALTGDEYEKSDLDLLIVADGDRARQLRDCFILEDTGVGYDLYLTPWEVLEEEACCPHAHLSRLMDTHLLYCRDNAALLRLDGLRKKAAAILASPARAEKAQALVCQAKQEYAEACFTDSLVRVRDCAGEAVYLLLDALMLFHGRYFRLGTKRTLQELADLKLPFNAETAVMNVLCGKTAENIRASLTLLFISVMEHMRIREEREAPSGENLSGSYEEMVSNWRNKMTEAAERRDVFSSYMNLGSMQLMYRELAERAAIPAPESMGAFDPEDLWHNAAVFDAALTRLAGEYEKAGLPIRRFPDLEAFLREYLPR